jgi:peroxiredoxin
MPIAVGSKAPDFSLPSSEIENGRPGKVISLGDFLGKKHVVLAFYPLDFSPTCTGEHGCFKNDFGAFDGLDAQVLGVSIDSAWAHAAFKRELGIDYPLLADFHPKGKMAESYGFYHADKGITGRGTVIVSKDGVVVYSEENPLGEARSNEKLIAALKAIG